MRTTMITVVKTRDDSSCFASPEKRHATMSSLLWITLSVLLLDFNQQTHPIGSKADPEWRDDILDDVGFDVGHPRTHPQRWETLHSSPSVTVLTVLLWLTASLQPEGRESSSLSSSFWASLVFAGTIASDLLVRNRMLAPPFWTGARYRSFEPSHSQTRCGYCSCCRSSLTKSSSTVLHGGRTREFPVRSVTGLLLCTSLQCLAPTAWLGLLAIEMANLGRVFAGGGGDLSSADPSNQTFLWWCGTWLATTVLHAYRRFQKSSVARPFDFENDDCGSLYKSGGDNVHWNTWSTHQVLAWVVRTYRSGKAGQLGGQLPGDACHKHAKEEEEEFEELRLVLEALTQERIQGDQLPLCGVDHPLLAGVLPRGALHRLQCLIQNQLLGPFPPIDPWDSSAATAAASLGPSPLLQRHDQTYTNPTGYAVERGLREVPGAGCDPQNGQGMQQPDLSHLPPSFLQGDVGLQQLLESLTQPTESAPVLPPLGTAASFLAAGRPQSASTEVLASPLTPPLTLDTSGMPPFIREIVQTRPDLVQQALKMHRRHRFPPQQPDGTALSELASSHTPTANAAFSTAAAAGGFQLNSPVASASSSNDIVSGGTGSMIPIAETDYDSGADSPSDGEETALLSKPHPALDAVLYKSIS